jgi:cell division transport system permease protein
MAVSRTAEPIAVPSGRTRIGEPADRRRAEAAERRRHKLLRRAGFDDLGMRQAFADRMLPVLVAAMAFLAALAIAGAFAAASLGAHWREGAGAEVTIQVPTGKAPAGEAPAGSASSPASPVETVLGLVRASPAVASAHALSHDELDALLRPWLGSEEERLALPLPEVVAVRLNPDVAAVEADRATALDHLTASLSAVAPGTVVESHTGWAAQLSALANSLRASATAVLVLVACIAALVVAVATHAGLLARRDAIEIVHDLGATDAYIAARFARRATSLAAFGALAGTLAAVPVILLLATLSAPFAGPAGLAVAASPGFGDTVGALIDEVPALLWVALPMIPAVAAALGWLTAAATVRRWLRQLP